MPWARYDDELPMNKKIAKLRAQGVNGIAALGLHVLCNTWSRNQGTGGHIEPHIPEQLVGRPGHKLARILAEVRMFDPHENGWLIHDFDDYSDPSDPDPHRSAADRRREISEKRAEAGRKGGNAKAQNKQTSSNGGSKSEALLQQTSSPGPDPVPSFVTGKDDDDLVNRGAESSSDIDIALDIAARATWLKDKSACTGNPDRFILGIRRNLHAEKTDELRRAIGSGRTPEQAAATIVGSQTHARLAARDLAAQASA